MLLMTSKIKDWVDRLRQRLSQLRAAEPEQSNTFELVDDFWNYRPVLMALVTLLLMFML